MHTANSSNSTNSSCYLETMADWYDHDDGRLYKLVGPPANCKESTTSEVMPRTLEDCKKAADALGRGFQDYTGKEGVHGETGLI